MNTLHINGTITALSPLHTGGEQALSTHRPLRSMDFVMPDGTTENLPYISGNGIRGPIRRNILDDLYTLLGYTVKTPRLHYLKSGGSLESVSTSDSGHINLEMKRELRKIPLLSLLGYSFGNQMGQGKLQVHMMLPICRELNHLLPIQSQYPIGNFLTNVFQTRKAEKEISETVQTNLREKETTQQMKYSSRCFAPGTKLCHKFVLNDASDVELSCFARMLELWRQNPIVGGKSAVGYGQIQFDYPEFNTTSDLYLQYITEHKNEINRILEKLDVNPPKPTKQKNLFPPKDTGLDTIIPEIVEEDE
jgi:CRISPR/Cas system CSM-associated protein Csm3 (group 7 of RAMP superfamily)